MLNKNDFRKAIGQPDKSFENSVQQALNDIIAAEKRRPAVRRPLRYILPFAVIAAAAACSLLFISTVFAPTPDNVTMPQVMSQPTVNTTPTSENTETDTTPAPVNMQATSEEYTEMLPESTTPPIAQGSLPEDHWMLEDTFHIGINDLYPGCTYVNELNDDDGNTFWVVSNGRDNYAACRVYYGAITKHEEGTEPFEMPTLTVYMATIVNKDEHVQTLIEATEPWLKELYNTGIAAAAEYSSDTGISIIQITFDENNEPAFCEMYFGYNSEIYIAWKRDDDGRFSLIKVYSEPEYVILDYDDPADYDTMEVTIPDAVLEAAIRAELNWQGKLTPAKLAELTELTIKNGGHIETLEGLQYCTNLENLMLPECGLDDDDMKYIGSMPSLFTLDLSGNNITDISPLAGLDLGCLFISNNSISNLWPLSGMTNLYMLILEGNPLSGTGALKPLAGLTGMRLLYLSECEITDVAPLAELYENAPLLDTIILDRNPVEDYDPIRHIDIHNLYWGY